MKINQKPHKNKTVSFISLGCSKNTVITEKIAYLFQERGYSIIPESSDTTYFFITTCCFLESARTECKEVLKELFEKYSIRESQIIVAGCYAYRYPKELLALYPSLSLISEQDPYKGMVDWLVTKANSEKRLLSSRYFSYLRIAEGCNRDCSYCLIPSIKGPYQSVSSKEILKECHYIADNFPVQELILIAQDTSTYGCEISNPENLLTLVKQISALGHFPWIRLLYLYPTLSVDHLQELFSIPHVVPYLDIPFQHLQPDILLHMNRPIDSFTRLENIVALRKVIPDLTIRSTFIVGFPGETHDDFQFLLNGLQKFLFDRVGFFAYSRERNTAAYDFDNQVPEEEKLIRLETAYRIQENIAKKRDSLYITRKLPVLLEEYDSIQQEAIGRSIREAPDIDPLIHIKGNPFWLKNNLGTIVEASITGVTDNGIEASIP